MTSSETKTRSPTAAERRHIDAVLLELRRHFRQWIDVNDPKASEHDLIGFADYEGQFGTECCQAILERATPLALGRQLVEKHGFAWVMVENAGMWHYGVRHEKLAGPIRLDALEDGHMLKTSLKDEEWRYAGQVTHASYEGILVELTKAPPAGGRRRGWKR